MKNVILGEVGKGGTLAARKRVFLRSRVCGRLRLWQEENSCEHRGLEWEESELPRRLVNFRV